MHEGSVTFAVPSGEAFVPRLFAELGVPIRSVHVARPSLDDVFMNYSGTTIRDAEAGSMDWARQMMKRSAMTTDVRPAAEVAQVSSHCRACRAG